jgi:hypothetical protein
MTTERERGAGGAPDEDGEATGGGGTNPPLPDAPRGFGISEDLAATLLGLTLLALVLLGIIPKGIIP